MGKIRLFFAASLDGFIADASGGVDFLDAYREDGRRYEQFMRNVDTLVMGRGTYQFVEDYGQWPYGKIRTIVLTRRPIPKPIMELETRTVDNTGAFAQELRSAARGDVWVVGGAQVMGQFLAAGEVDTIEMSIVPIAIGTGIPMYAAASAISQRFSLLEMSRSALGVVRLVYERA